MTIGGYFINDCWWLLMDILLVYIGGYFIIIILMAIGDYSIGRY